MWVNSRYIVAWGLHNTLQAENVRQVLLEAVGKHGVPEIVNSDQSSQFTCPLWVETLQEHGIRISMDGKGRAFDNVYIERFWRTIKQDYIYLNPCGGLELYRVIKEFIRYYNDEKSIRALGAKRLMSCTPGLVLDFLAICKQRYIPEKNAKFKPSGFL